MKNKESKICFLDFDHTLFDTDVFFHDDMREAARKLGVGDELWDQSYRAVWESGYSAEKHLREMARLRGDQTLVQKGMQAFEIVFKNMPAHVYPDVIPFLTRAREKDMRLILVSFGDPGWQEFKVTHSGLRPLLDTCFFTDRQGGKGEVIKQESAAYAHAMLVDDNARELDAAKSLVPNLEIFWMQRKKDDKRGSDAAALGTLAAASADPHTFTPVSCKSFDEVVI